MDDIQVFKGKDGTFTVAEYGTWIPGVYDTRETAIAAAKLSPDDVATMWDKVLAAGRITATINDVGSK
jgi:hypothetical protein